MRIPNAVPSMAWILAVPLLVLSCKGKSGDEEKAPAAAEAPRPAESATQAPPKASPPPAPTAPAIPAPPDVASPPTDATKTASGLVTKILTPGKGTVHPRPQDRVSVHYTGWTTDGHMFDSSVARGTPATFGVNQVIPGWTEALQLMVQGEKRRLWIPGNLAYGDHPRPGAPAGTLVFDVELLDVSRAPDPPPVPEDVAAPPKSAKKTQSGLAYRVLKPGTGKQPTASSVVVVHYTGWTTKGEMFDSSVMRGQPATFRLDQVIKGWTEGVQLMKVGEKARFWIPGALAYGDTPARPGAPAGMLVFDIELLDVK